MEFAVTCLFVPTSASANVAVPVTVIESPEIRVSEYVTDAASEELYTLLLAEMVTVNDRAAIVDSAVGAPTKLSE